MAALAEAIDGDRPEVVAGQPARRLLALAKQFSESTPADVFGFVPDQIYGRAITRKSLRPWVGDKAEPIVVLRFATWKPDHIAAIWTWLVVSLPIR